MFYKLIFLSWEYLKKELHNDLYMQFSGFCHPLQTSAKTTSGYENHLQFGSHSSHSYAKVTGCSCNTHFCMKGFWRTEPLMQMENKGIKKKHHYKSYLSWRELVLLLLEMCILLFPSSICAVLGWAGHRSNIYWETASLTSHSVQSVPWWCLRLNTKDWASESTNDAASLLLAHLHSVFENLEPLLPHTCH